MALNVALGEPQWAAARVLHSPLSGEVSARLCAIAGLKRRLAEERAALSENLGTRNPSRGAGRGVRRW